VAPPAAVAQLVPGRLGLGVLRQLDGQVGRHLDHPRRVVDVEADLELVPAAPAGGLPGLGVERDQELAAHRGDGVAVLVAAVDRHHDRHALAALEGGHHLLGDHDADVVAAVGPEGGAEGLRGLGHG
jgi:hypothetical protein